MLGFDINACNDRFSSISTPSLFQGASSIPSAQLEQLNDEITALKAIVQVSDPL